MVSGSLGYTVRLYCRVLLLTVSCVSPTCREFIYEELDRWLVRRVGFLFGCNSLR
jgi:hypothetical protein